MPGESVAHPLELPEEPPPGTDVAEWELHKRDGTEGRTVPGIKPLRSEGRELIDNARAAPRGDRRGRGKEEEAEERGRN